MVRLARVVVPGLPYHVTHRGESQGGCIFHAGGLRDLPEINNLSPFCFFLAVDI